MYKIITDFKNRSVNDADVDMNNIEMLIKEIKKILYFNYSSKKIEGFKFFDPEWGNTYLVKKHNVCYLDEKSTSSIRLEDCSDDEAIFIYVNIYRKLENKYCSHNICESCMVNDCCSSYKDEDE